VGSSYLFTTCTAKTINENSRLTTKTPINIIYTGTRSRKLVEIAFSFSVDNFNTTQWNSGVIFELRM
jgi:hypothetical protein